MFQKGRLFRQYLMELKGNLGTLRIHSDPKEETLHRRENHDIMDVWFEKISTIAKNYPEYKFTIPLHPNPNVQKHKHLLTHVNVESHTLTRLSRLLRSD